MSFSKQERLGIIRLATILLIVIALALCIQLCDHNGKSDAVPLYKQMQQDAAESADTATVKVTVPEKKNKEKKGQKREKGAKDKRKKNPVKESSSAAKKAVVPDYGVLQDTLPDFPK